MSTDTTSSPMPVDLPPASKVYQDQMTTLTHGLALWNPDPPKEIYHQVSIGDVGYLHEGCFIRMFNAMLPWSHESNRALGEPEPYESLDCGPFANTIKRPFDRVKHCSRYVSAETYADRQDMTSDDIEGVTYKFRNCGALLSLPNGGHHEDIIRAQPFGNYISGHANGWFTWAQKYRLGVERVEDIILVSGCTLVTSWAAAAFVDDTTDAEISLASRMFNNGSASFVWSNIRGRVFYHNSRLDPVHGEQKSTMPQDQCVFIRGFRVKGDKMQVIRVSSAPEYDDPNIGIADAIGPPIKNESPEPSSYRHPNLSCATILGNNSVIGGSSSSLDTIWPPTNHADLQLLPYPSSTTLQSNGSVFNSSFMTSPSCDSFFEVPNHIAERARKIRHEDAIAEDTTSITLDLDLPYLSQHPPNPYPSVTAPGYGVTTIFGRGVLKSTVEQVVTDNPQYKTRFLAHKPHLLRFRILVVGKRGSGKSSLIKSIFGVEMAASERRSSINLAFRPDDNRRLIVHEYSGLDPSGLQIIQNFITNRTDLACAPAERLHTIWICVPTSDVIDGIIGEGIDEILNMTPRRVPVVVTFTKCDLAFPNIWGFDDGFDHHQDRTRSRTYALCEELCRSLFRGVAKNVPAELVSVTPPNGALINNLVVTTDRIMDSYATPLLSGSPGTKPLLRISPVPLVWSVALRASRDINIQTSIEIGRSQYWRNLWSSLDFATQPLKNCVNIIHIDIIKIWNLNDRCQYLSSNQFKMNMSHVVKDLAMPAGDSLPIDWNVSGNKFADWVDGFYGGSEKDVRCVMGYIVNLTVILDVIFRTTAGNVTEVATLKAMITHVRSSHRKNIHWDIRTFVKDTFMIRFASQEKDPVLDMIVVLIRRYSPLGATWVT